MRRIVPLLVVSLLGLRPAAAHEFWIAPDAYQVAPGDAIAADLRNGERFSGRALSLMPQRTERFEIVQGDRVAAAEGRIGDRPALAQPAPGEGLAVLVHETDDHLVSYDDLARFERFAAHKGFPEIAEAHRAGGLPMPVRERYRRYAKSLVGVGDAAGADRPVGLRAEIVALANPYVEALAEMPVALLYEGEPAADRQIEVFARVPDGTVEVTTVTTDAEGRAVVPLEPGTEVMLDSVFAEPVAPGAEDEAAWATHWANLTFAVP